MTLQAWRKLNADWPEETKADGSTLRTVWVLEELKPK